MYRVRHVCASAMALLESIHLIHKTNETRVKMYLWKRLHPHRRQTTCIICILHNLLYLRLKHNIHII